MSLYGIHRKQANAWKFHGFTHSTAGDTEFITDGDWMHCWYDIHDIKIYADDEIPKFKVRFCNLPVNDRTEVFGKFSYNYFPIKRVYYRTDYIKGRANRKSPKEYIL